MDAKSEFDVVVSITWREPGDTKDHVTSQLYPNKDHAFVAEVQRRVMKGLQTPA